ncbi:MFS general substrate transporter [Auriculariales sp. MPI-PUGE-AT-0066]|nr:MFS general substrate transporter [Auriculariales sp. MPI-PUGE-AT-0066]
MTELAHTVTDASSDVPLPVYGALRRYTLLLIFCCSQFLDAFNVSALLSAIPVMTVNLGLTSSEAVWLVSAYQLSFAALLLSSGRISDIYNPKFVFVGGAAVLGIFSIAAGFADNKIALFVLRAFSGIAAAMTIPSSLTLLIRLFPDPAEQARAIGVYGGSAALGNVLGLILGALLIEYANWSWPKIVVEGNKIVLLDLPGISILTVSLILLIFAFTSTGTESWGSAMVLAPLVISIFGVAGFFIWEAWIPVERAAFPPRTWRYPNFGILIAVALSVFLWFVALFYLILTMWQDVYGWSAVNAAVHFLPVGLVAGPLMIFSASWTERFEKKYILIASQVLVIISTVILPFADSPDKYWRLAFPSFIIGSAGASLLFVNANVALFQSTPTEIAGVIASVFNSALQLGSAVGVAIITSIQLAIDKKNIGNADANPYAGRAAGFWFLLAIVALETIAVVVFYRTNESTLAETSSIKLEKTKSTCTSGVATPAAEISQPETVVQTEKP